MGTWWLGDCGAVAEEGLAGLQRPCLALPSHLYKVASLMGLSLCMHLPGVTRGS
jgi:hypothetical protein